MNDYSPDKKYESFKIPERDSIEEVNRAHASSREAHTAAKAQEGDMFYEIEYDACPMPGVGKFVLKSQKVEQPERDEVRELFYRMRDIAHNYRPSYYTSNKFFDKRVQKENARLFYKQGVFMKDFEDQCSKSVTYSAYFPNYQMMGYDQLRTYFTWRTLVRQGEVKEVSLSYAFLYIYELLCNIGVDDPQEGLERLIFFWKAFREYDGSIDRYVPRWVKDYYIYYDLPGAFQEFIEKKDLRAYYPEPDDSEGEFELLCGISKYDIRKSNFYTKENEQLIKDCFEHVMNKVRQVLEGNGLSFEESVFQPTKKMAIWEPFKGALFYDWKNQRNRQVVLSRKEVYICTQNQWSFSSLITTESGKRLVGYVMKQTEAVLRRLTGYKYKLSADINTVNHETVEILEGLGFSLERIITEAVTEAYREATKTVVKVDPGILKKIRQEALITQEKLTVPEEEEWRVLPDWTADVKGDVAVKYTEAVKPAENGTVRQEFTGSFEQASQHVLQHHNAVKSQKSDCGENTADSPAGPWKALRDTLTDMELQALTVLCGEVGERTLKQFADQQGMMLEVLMDGINEKAMDCVGDSLTDDEFVIYEDYIEEVRKMAKGIG